MRYGLLVFLICLGLLCDLGVYIATSDDSFDSFDPLRPATILPIIADRFRNLRDQVGEVLRDLVEGFSAPYRERMHRDLPTEPLPQ